MTKTMAMANWHDNDNDNDNDHDVYLRSEMQKAADPADISVLFFPAGANFSAMHAKKMYQHQCY